MRCKRRTSEPAEMAKYQFDNADLLEEEDDSDDEIDEINNHGTDGGENNHPEVDLQDDSILKFEKHTNTVCSCLIHKNDSVVTGDVDMAYVWDIHTGTVISEIHEHGVLYSAFNHDGTLLATSDCHKSLIVWKFQSMEKLCEMDIQVHVWLAWQHNDNVLFGGSLFGIVWKWSVPNGALTTFDTFGDGLCEGKLLPDGERMIAAYNDGFIRVWNINTMTVLRSVFVGFVSDSFFGISLDCSQEKNLILSSSHSTSLKLISLSTGEVLNSFPVDSSPLRDIKFSPRSSLAIATTEDETWVILDTSSQTILHRMQNMGEVYTILWHPVFEKAFCSCTEGAVRLLDAVTGSEEKVWKGSGKKLDHLALTSDGSKLIGTFRDNKYRVFQYSV